MKKIIVLTLSLIFVAASCDLGFGDLSGSGTRGVFKSEDKGQTYAAANALIKGDINGEDVNSLVFDSSNPSILYLGSSSGIFKTEDSAKSWRYILSGIAVASMSVDPFQSSTVYAAGLSGQQGKVIKSLDSGASWVDAYTEPSKNNPVTAVVANGQSVLAGLATGEVIRSSDAGRTWQATTDAISRVISIQFGSDGRTYALTSKNGLYRSTDSGVTWKNVTESLTQDILSNPGQAISVSTFETLALDKKQSGVVYLGTDQGLFRTINDGTNWSFMALPVKDSSLRVSGVGIDPTDSNTIIAGIDSTVFKSVNGGVTWETKVLVTNNIYINYILVNSQSNNYIYLGLSSKP